MLPDSLQPMATAAISAMVGAGFVGWIVRRTLTKVDTLVVEVTKLSVMITSLAEIKGDIRAHEKRLTLLEPKTDAAHKRLDDVIGSRH